MLIQSTLRQADDYGEGHFGASRGSRTHKGVDYAVKAGGVVCSTVYGRVTKLGYPYADDLSYRYIDIEDAKGYHHRYFYVKPCVAVGDTIRIGQPIGNCQDSAPRYNKNGKTITNHVHYEVLQYKDGKKVFSDPNKFYRID